MEDAIVPDAAGRRILRRLPRWLKALSDIFDSPLSPMETTGLRLRRLAATPAIGLTRPPRTMYLSVRTATRILAFGRDRSASATASSWEAPSSMRRAILRTRSPRAPESVRESMTVILFPVRSEIRRAAARLVE
jgi:hypothetical protein